jgi:N-acetylated-alpha-linked acidic dipeptidase
MLMDSERKLTLEKGLPGRPWYRHYVDAPGQYTGYAPKTLPAVREAIESKHWKEADEEIGVTADVLNAEAALIKSAAEKLTAATH